MLEAVRESADIAMRYFRKDPDVWYKNEGRSPVSEADVAVDVQLRSVLLAGHPEYGWLSEESDDSEQRLSHDRVFIVDPIDGTRAYVAGKPDWCISIGLVDNGVAVAGVLAAPARGEIWHARLGCGAFRNEVRLTPDRDSVPAGPLRVFLPDSVAKAMRPGGEASLEKLSGGPSLALRLAAVAESALDGVYIRPRSNEWDLAAADVMLAETGHLLVDGDGRRMSYNAPDPSRGLLVAASPSQLNTLMGLLEHGHGH